MPKPTEQPVTYQFSVWAFTSREIDQLVSLVKDGMHAGLMPIDKRKFTKQVLDCAKSLRIVREKYGRLYPDCQYVEPSRNDLPIEVLWRLCKPMIERATGFSIVKDKGWSDLGIWSMGQSRYTDRDFDAQVRVIELLAQYGYIWFQQAGSVWDISKRVE